MDKSDITLAAGAIGLIFFLKWIFKSESKHPSLQQAQQDERGNAATSNAVNINRNNAEDNGNGNGRRYRRAVTQDMIDVVKSIGPHLTVEQIRYDLEKTGSVEETVNTFLSTGTLPVPPNTPARSANNVNNRTDSVSTESSSRTGSSVAQGQDSATSLKKKCHFVPENLISKYNVDVNKDYSNVDYKTLSLDEKKQYMIWKARKGYLEALNKQE
ncbi:hypothetical protein ACO0QE_003782 [Hanseniaspora vineae]